MSVPNLSGKNLGGGPYNGWSPVQTDNNKKSSEEIMSRRIVVRGWNTAYATGIFNGKTRIVTPFRAVNSLGDFLQRPNYSFGGPNQINADKPGWKGIIRSKVSISDGSGVPATYGNNKFVSDSSDYVRYKN